MTKQTKPYYECHITLEGNKNFAKQLVEDNGWKFSCIDGDPTLGDGVKCYATRHYNTREGELKVKNALHEVADNIAFQGGDLVKVIRKKIEHVIYDDRSETVNCNGACPECHLDDLT